MAMPNETWLRKYEGVKEKLYCKVDLESYFKEKSVGGVDVDVIEMGSVHFPTGTIFACDPLVDLEECLPYFQKIPAGTYPVKICVAMREDGDERYACAKVAVSNGRPVCYEMAMVGNENLDAELSDDSFFGFGVDAGMGCVADVRAQEAYNAYWEKRLEEDECIDCYNDLFCDVLEESAREHPTHQRKDGDWANWPVPGSDCSIPIFAAGWGDGVYPCFFGRDEDGAVCGVYVWFIDIAEEYADED